MKRRRRQAASTPRPPEGTPPRTSPDGAPAAAGAVSTTRSDWPFLIGHLLIVKTELARLDPATGERFGTAVPHLGASPQRLDLLTDTLGGPLDRLHRSLLTEIDGWSSVLLGIDLLKTGQLGNPMLRAILRDRWELALEDSEHDAHHWEVFAARQDLADLVAVGRSGTPVAGQVLWWAQEEVDRYVDLVEWFASAIAYHRLKITRIDASSQHADLSLLTTLDDE